jgi:hypothetical protein
MPNPEKPVRDAAWTKTTGEILEALEASAKRRHEIEAQLEAELDITAELLQEGDKHGVPVRRMTEALDMDRGRVLRMLGGEKGKWTRAERLQKESK